VLRAARKTAVGSVAIDLASGTVRGLDYVPDCLIPPEDGSCLDDHTRVTLDWQQLDDQIVLSVRVGEIVRELERGAGLVARLTPNGRHVLVRAEPEPRWRIYRSDIGELAATVTYEPGADSPCVLGDRIYYLLEQVKPSGARADILIARDIATDQLIWELRLSERTVKAPPPPRP
jgi:hypothetical protein